MTKFIINPANENEILSIEGCRDEIEKLIGKNDERKKKLLKIINHYGVNNQQRKLAEEVFELQEAIINYELKASVEYEIPLTEIIGSKEHIAEEMADCMVLLSQFKEHYGISEKELQEVAKYKINRQLERIQKAKGDVKNEI